MRTKEEMKASIQSIFKEVENFNKANPDDQLSVILCYGEDNKDDEESYCGTVLVKGKIDVVISLADEFINNLTK